MKTYDDNKDLIKQLRNNKVILGHGEYGVDTLCELAANVIERSDKEIKQLKSHNKKMADVINAYCEEFTEEAPFSDDFWNALHFKEKI